MNLQHVIDGCIINNLIIMNRNSIKILGGLVEPDMSKKVVCFGVDGASTF